MDLATEFLPFAHGDSAVLVAVSTVEHLFCALLSDFHVAVGHHLVHAFHGVHEIGLVKIVPAFRIAEGEDEA